MTKRLSRTAVQNECYDLVVGGNQKYADGLRRLFGMQRGDWVDLVELKPDTLVPRGRVFVCWVTPLAIYPKGDFRTVIWVDDAGHQTLSAHFNLEALPSHPE